MVRSASLQFLVVLFPDDLPARETGTTYVLTFQYSMPTSKHWFSEDKYTIGYRP